MKKGLIALAILLLAGVGLWLLAPTTECQGEACNTEQTQTVAAQASAKAEQGEAYLYDVRTPEEYNSAHATNAVNFDNELIQAGQLPDAPKDSEIYVYCRSGNRSAEATQALQSAGYTNVTDLGGLDTMTAAGVL